jgi:hypothetical protein
MDENLVQDQVQKDSPVVAEAPKGPKTIKKDQAPQEQSETTVSEPVKESKLYKLPDGREVSADELYSEHTEKLLPEFTRRSQKLAEIERKESEMQERNKRAAEESVSQNKLLEDVDPSVREAIVQMVSPVIQQAFAERERADAQKRDQEKFDARLKELESKYPGGNGLPKFDRMVILRKMQEPGNEVYNPEVLYKELNWDTYIDYFNKQAMKGKSGGVSTESTSTEAPRRPGETAKPASWAEASRRAATR